MVCGVVVFLLVLVCLCVVLLFSNVSVGLFASYEVVCCLCVRVCVKPCLVVMYGLMLCDGDCLRVFVFVCVA